MVNVVVLDKQFVIDENGRREDWTRYSASTESVAVSIGKSLGIIDMEQDDNYLPNDFEFFVCKLSLPQGVETSLELIERDGNGIRNKSVFRIPDIEYMFNCEIEDLDGLETIFWEREDARVESIVDVLDSISRKMTNGPEIYPISEEDLTRLRDAAIEQDELEIASSIERKNQFETYMKLFEHVRGFKTVASRLQSFLPWMDFFATVVVLGKQKGE